MTGPARAARTLESVHHRSEPAQGCGAGCRPRGGSASMNKPLPPVYEFGEFQLDASHRVLLRAGAIVPLTPKAFDTLLVLVRQGGRVVGKDELMREVWPDSFVEENSLARNISVLRRLLDGGHAASACIETVPKRGYRFVPAVTAQSPETAPSFQWGRANQTAVERCGDRGSGSRQRVRGVGSTAGLVHRASKGPRPWHPAVRRRGGRRGRLDVGSAARHTRGHLFSVSQRQRVAAGAGRASCRLTASGADRAGRAHAVPQPRPSGFHYHAVVGDSVPFAFVPRP